MYSDRRSTVVRCEQQIGIGNYPFACCYVRWRRNMGEKEGGSGGQNGIRNGARAILDPNS